MFSEVIERDGISHQPHGLRRYPSFEDRNTASFATVWAAALLLLAAILTI